MRSIHLACAVFAGLLLLAGCMDRPAKAVAGGDTVVLAADPFEAARVLMADVPCEAPVREGTSGNLLVLASMKYEEGGTGDIDVRGPLLATTRSLHDVSDPLHPVQTADFEALEIAASGDVKFLSDNETIVTGTSGGILLIDVRDPAAPVVEDEWSFEEFSGVNLPGGSVFLNAHMLGTAKIGGSDWVFLAPNSNSGIWILRVDGEPGSRQLTYVTQTLPAEGGPLGPHDLFVHQDPFTSQWLLYSADGFHGWTVFDLADPTSPVPIGGLVAPQPGYTHTIQAARFGERRLVVTIAEVGENLLQVFDATILQAPVLLATWQVAPLSTTPQHNINIVGDHLYVAHYGYGMYVFDLTTVPGLPLAGVASFDPVAHYDPVPGGTPYVAGIGGFEAVYDVVVQDGLLFVSGFSAPLEGIDVIGFGCIAPGDQALRSVG
ncbi:MAG TPA: hypothetical protein VM327_10935 [Candidatus Thermoplasmatota archaeon]|nr:hypothetical protein [Candidatus Thermoplasmatota archaeon]